jgi:hypothetical protein
VSLRQAHGARLPHTHPHTNRPQVERTATFLQFSQALGGVLLCTDVAARGLDFPAVTTIIQYDPPGEAAEYVHRVGRTARIGQQGSALLFLQPAERMYATMLQQHGIQIAEDKADVLLGWLPQLEEGLNGGRWASGLEPKARLAGLGWACSVQRAARSGPGRLLPCTPACCCVGRGRPALVRGRVPCCAGRAGPGQRRLHRALRRALGWRRLQGPREGPAGSGGAAAPQADGRGGEGPRDEGPRLGRLQVRGAAPRCRQPALRGPRCQSAGR